MTGEPYLLISLTMAIHATLSESQITAAKSM